MTMKSTAGVPTAEWVDPMALMADPYPTYQRLLDESPGGLGSLVRTNSW